VHRLDTGTSGVLVAARTPESHAALRASFRRHEVGKRYVAVVIGLPAPGIVVDVPLAHDPSDRRRMRAAQPGDRAWPARSLVCAVQPCGDRTRVEIEIRTGSRSGARASGVVGLDRGDALYSGTEACCRRARALHAASPLPGRAPLTAPPADLAALIRSERPLADAPVKQRRRPPLPPPL
jgi:23S rRNA-/tRNA-specific pseudouridylate synthase